MQRFKRIIEYISDKFNLVAGACVTIMALLVVANVIARRLPFFEPILGTFDIAGYLGLGVIALALAKNQIRKGNIRVDFFVQRLPLRTQMVFDSVTYLACTGIMGIASWRTFVYAHALWVQGDVAPTLLIPFFPLVYLMALCLTLLTLVLLTDFIESVQGALKR